MSKPITIKDIAKKLNVSVATVSRALRGSTEIKKETKMAVLEMAKEMDYHPNLLASSLSSKKSKIIGVVVPTINRYFWSNSISGIENIAYKKGYKVMIFQSGESFTKEAEIVETLANSKVDGIIIAFSKETKDFIHVQDVINRGIPVVMLERACKKLTASKVRTDDKNGAYTITKHLISKGRKNIAYICGPLSLDVCRDRQKGFQDALKEAALPYREEFVVEVEDFRFDQAGRALEKLWGLQIKPDGILCFADILAIGTIHAAENLGIKIPDQLSIAGFGDDETSRFIRPAITTMSQPSFEMGELAAQIILEEIQLLGEPHPIRSEIIKPQIIIREST
ncbi:LacI family DNA-binding transcriptional regulator [Cyclobacterium sp. 1_MG-2023]|uniref:LacI family DNA-binding transcriptional regulator n=1 Tax=Cyclobacterium sp. 1_MG-2023 TaxID=3062681 RepID=UPI0026E3FBBD|nr:LacI family DNA-binding transcriptional regulator [Cyclobacterium sp. 1_MG-2023]MDO6438924.1 LacI family DNA-binding transcriptional regulator [Cyclobacterium sp. 1_MG-2023]